MNEELSLATVPMQTYFAVLPSDITQSALGEISQSSDQDAESSGSVYSHRYLRLPHPRTGRPGLYLPVTSTHSKDVQILEVQSIDPERKRSWFHENEVISDGSLLLMTPVNPAYVVIPLLVALATSETTSIQTALEDGKSGSRTDRYLPFDDLTESLSKLQRCRLEGPFTRLPLSSKPKGKQKQVLNEDEDDVSAGADQTADGGGLRTANEDVLRLCRIENVRHTLKRFCETEEIGSDTFYRPSLSAVLDWLRTKLDNLAVEGTFESIPSMKRSLVSLGLGHLVRSSTTAIGHEEKEGVDVDITVAVEATRKEADKEVLGLARVRIASEILGEYLEPQTRDALLVDYDFDKLDRYLDTQNALSFAASQPIMQSNGMNVMMDALEGSETNLKKAGLKRKGSEKGTRAAESLKKVNTSKMPKLTTFFKKK